MNALLDHRSNPFIVFYDFTKSFQILLTSKDINNAAMASGPLNLTTRCKFPLIQSKEKNVNYRGSGGRKRHVKVGNSAAPTVTKSLESQLV